MGAADESRRVRCRGDHLLRWRLPRRSKMPTFACSHFDVSHLIAIRIHLVDLGASDPFARIASLPPCGAGKARVAVRREYGPAEQHRQRRRAAAIRRDGTPQGRWHCRPGLICIKRFVENAVARTFAPAALGRTVATVRIHQSLPLGALHSLLGRDGGLPGG
jgi:hypothetical protein